MRAVAYYISAWYGVDYSERVKYLMNAAFWWDRGFHHQPTSGYGYPFDDPNASAPEVDDAPSNFEPGGMGLMYSLYERNLDFRLLHDIFVEHGDADRAEELCALKVGMFFHHPRGVLHVARMSRHGFREAVERIPDRCMREGFGPPNSARIKEGFLAYCRRVAGDGSDPLRGTARRLLRQVRRAHA